MNNLNNEFIELVKNVMKYNSNPIAFGEMIELFYLESEKINKKIIEKFNEYRNSPEYKTKLKLALDRIRELVRDDMKAVKEVGYQHSKKYVDKDFLEMWKKRLMYLEKEALEMNI